MAFLGIMLVAFNVRTAVSAISPIVDPLTAELPLSALELGVIGTIPALAFAFSALFGAAIARHIGIERLLALAILAMIVGHVLRATSTSYATLLLGTVIALAGAGVGNVLLPPLVKRYFPDRIGLVTALYVSLVSVSAAVPSAIAAPVTDAAGWRFSLGLWAVVAVICLLPWLVILLRHRREAARMRADGEAAPIEEADQGLIWRVWRSRVAWAVALTFSLSSSVAYSSFAWLPLLVSDIAGVGQVEAGIMLGVFALMGVPSALIIPILAARMRNVGLLVYTGIGFLLVGYAGLLLAPVPLVWLWVLLIGCGPLLFPLALVLINLRSRTHQGAVALSGFVQGVGYLLAAAGPFVFGLLHELTGGWMWPMLFMIVLALGTAVAGLALRHPSFVEDELAAPRR